MKIKTRTQTNSKHYMPPWCFLNI